MEKHLKEVRRVAPLVHSITNYVTVNDVANIILAAGGSPIMADEPSEVSEITSICSALNINIGTLNKETIEAMFIAGRTANEKDIPIILDPVGAGASTLRTETTLKLIQELRPKVIKGNISEIKALAGDKISSKGVDADVSDRITDESISASIDFSKNLARKFNTTLAITGPIDLVTDGKYCYVIKNGRPEMESITGTGCMLSGLTAAYIGANKDDILGAVACAIITMGLAGEIAYENLESWEGNATYRNKIIDSIYRMTPEKLKEGAKYEIR